MTCAALTTAVRLPKVGCFSDVLVPVVHNPVTCDEARRGACEDRRGEGSTHALAVQLVQSRAFALANTCLKICRKQPIQGFWQAGYPDELQSEEPRKQSP